MSMVETDEMLRERITRSVSVYGSTYKGERLPYEPRQGPVFKTEAEQRQEAFEHELSVLEERYWVELGGDYYINVKTCCNCSKAAVLGKQYCLRCLDAKPEPR